MKHILIIEDDSAEATLMSSYLKEKNYNYTVADGAYDALEKIKEKSPDLIFLDLGLPDMDGMSLLKKIRQEDNHIEIHVLTGNDSTELAVQCIHEGAKNYIIKPVNQDLLYVCIENAFERIDLNRQLKRLKQSQTRDGIFYNLIGRSNVMLSLYKTIENVSNITENILISGEHGSGKTSIAKTIHDVGERNDRPFIKINCMTLDPSVAREALTKGIKDAEGGTLFLNNVDNLPLKAQGDLLMLLEDDLNIRLICASDSGPLSAVKKGTLREDLFYRINIIPIDVPPLRRRAQDKKLLAGYFLERFSQEHEKSYEGFDETTLRIFEDYHWPGNVLELQNMIKAIVLLQPDGHTITATMLPEHMAKMATAESADEDKALVDASSQDIFGSEIIAMRDLEKMAIIHALATCEGNVQEAALKLKISPATLYRKKPID